MKGKSLESLLVKEKNAYFASADKLNANFDANAAETSADRLRSLLKKTKPKKTDKAASAATGA